MTATTYGVDAQRRRGLLARVFADRGVLTKIATVVGLLTALALVVGAVAINGMRTMNHDADAIYTHGVLPVQQIDDVQLAMDQTRRNMLNYAISTTPANLKKYEEALAENDDAFTANLNIYRANSIDPAAADTMGTDWAEFQRLRDSALMPAAKRGDLEAVEAARDNVVLPAATAANAIAKTLRLREQAAAQARQKSAAEEYTRDRNLMIVILSSGPRWRCRSPSTLRGRSSAVSGRCRTRWRAWPPATSPALRRWTPRTSWAR